MATTTPENVHEKLQKQIDIFIERNPKSYEVNKDASTVIGGGTTKAVLVHSPFPPAFVGGRDCYLTSVDGHEYLDFVSEYCAGMFGHSHPRIQEVITEVCKAGFVLGGPTPNEGKLARALTERFASFDAVRFCNSGTEANTFALATALAFTQKKKVLVFENGYHGGTLSFSRHNRCFCPTSSYTDASMTLHVRGSTWTSVPYLSSRYKAPGAWSQPRRPFSNTFVTRRLGWARF
ncbi:PLP-dependent transferase [Sporormia fimetaria CBS 119925]|uniref:PLP-dependent transferase n=1 Tax=Sporormia fimetaria CBS 119925 TaxID=1340428 RepID=A0A6A6V575_9PLEO|nr:PLP-dependent transferase [Sporormia fimetaria CBS 119925]